MGSMRIACAIVLTVVAATPSWGYFWPLFTPVYSSPRLWQPLQLPSFQDPIPTFSHAAFPMNLPSLQMPSFPSLSMSPSLSTAAKCEIVANEQDLSFPGIESTTTDVKKVTFICSDKSSRRFYFLKTTGKKTTSSSHSETSAGSYYSLSKKPLDLDKDLDVDKTSLWEAAAQAEYEYNQLKNNPFGSLFSPIFKPSFASLMMPSFGESSAECEKQDNFVNVEYPKIDISEFKPVNDEIISHKITNETYTCTKKDGSKYYTLKTVLDYSTRKGGKFNSHKSVSYPLLADGAIDISKPSAVTSGSGASASMAQSSGFSSVTF